MTNVPADVLDRVRALADRAPSVHGTKPWWWQATPEGLELYVRAERQLATADPTGRDLTISCGAALYSLEVAAAAEGWRARIHRLPEPWLRSLLARVEFEPHETTPADRARTDVIAERRIDRSTGPSRPVPHALVEEAWSLAQARGVFAIVVEDKVRVEQVLRLLAEAAHVQDLDRGYLSELALWNQRRRPIHLDDTDATWIVLATTSDDRLCWLRTGEALQAVWLWAASHGLTLVPHSQAIEVPAVRSRLQHDLFQDATCPQLLLRLAWAPVAVAG